MKANLKMGYEMDKAQSFIIAGTIIKDNEKTI